MKRNKVILSIILIIAVLLVAGASIYISTRVSQEQAVAPTAPTSKPRAAEGVAECAACNATTACAGGLSCDSVDGLCKKADGTSTCWVGSAACAVSATTLCVASEVVTCSSECPTSCGSAESTLTNCTDSCGIATTKKCAATAACSTSGISIEKKAYKDEASNAAGNYSLKSTIKTVLKDQTFVYNIAVKNTGSVAIPEASVTDTLNGQNQDWLSLIDADTGCTYTEGTKKVECTGISLPAGAKASYSFRVKVSDNAVTGGVIKNTATVLAGTINESANNQLTVATTAAVRITETATRAGEVSIVEPTTLPETGILDFPGVAAFGGGLLLAVVGILLAL